eukprot:NODE_2475_length_928_cov_330.731959.p1 GENE.NODE_2475_length_928_cov_330.731959~~NODE_2475_length_928_cov_330.731959.p1  ORF type:complete len:268 (+),score=90.61 NODE_2475_length_928_cov_330.731959:3-806(+)
MGAGEAAPGQAVTMPSAIFAYYMPHHPFCVEDHHAGLTRLEFFPVTNATITYPKLPGASKVQVEPELGLYVDIVYSADRSRVERLVPRRVAAFNDCSIRKMESSSKLSQRKNWGFASAGISLRSFPIDSFSPGSFVDQLALVSYAKRDGEVVQYSVNAPVRNYLLFHEPLLEWIVGCINGQQETGQWEEIFPALVESDYPTSSWIALGAGKYTEWGAENYLKVGDEIVIMVYDERKFPQGPDMALVLQAFADGHAPEGIVTLHQTFL